MKKIATVLILFFVGMTTTINAQNAQEFKFGHINLQETIYLMSEMDSATVVLEKYSAHLQETFTSMQNEFYTKYNTYQQMSANWTPAVLETKSKELQEMEQRIQSFQQSAQQELQDKQSELLKPIYLKANDALKKVGKENKFTYIFDISASGLPYVNESVSVDVTEMVKKVLNIPLDKKISNKRLTE